VWSVWSERVDVYLGTGLVLVQRPGIPLWRFDPPATLPLVDVLRQVNQALERAKAKPWRLRVCLSASLCPPVAFALPAGVQRYAEVLAIAKANAVQVWDMPPEQATELECRLDARHQGLAAAMLSGTYGVIARWATEHKGRMTNLQPLWAVATGAKVCAKRHETGVAVLEPDALTVLKLDATGALQAKSWLGAHGQAETMSRLADMTDQANQAQQKRDVVMVFNQEPTQTAWEQGPPVWTKHWSVLP